MCSITGSQSADGKTGLQFEWSRGHRPCFIEPVETDQCRRVQIAWHAELGIRRGCAARGANHLHKIPDEEVGLAEHRVARLCRSPRDNGIDAYSRKMISRSGHREEDRSASDRPLWVDLRQSALRRRDQGPDVRLLARSSRVCAGTRWGSNCWIRLMLPEIPRQG
jgi:hypothetical protein